MSLHPKLLWLTCLCSLLMLASGCPEPDGDDDDTSADDDDDDAGDDDTVDPCAPAAHGQVGETNTDPIEPYVTGLVYDATGTQPMVGIKATYCIETSCIQASTDENGRYWFDDLTEGLGVLFIAGNQNTDGGAFVSITAGFETPETSFEAPDILLPEVDPLLSLEAGATLLDVGDGLMMEVGADEMDWKAREPCFGAVEIPEETMEFAQYEGIEMLAAWGFHGYGNEWPGGLPVAFPVRGELECDQPVQIYAMDKELADEESPYHNLFHVATGYHDCDQGLVVTDEGESVELLTWLAYGVELD